MELAKRKDVPIELTWDLSAIFPTEEAFAAALEETKSLASQLESTYKGALNTPENIQSCLTLYQKMCVQLNLCGSYRNLAASVDYNDARLQEEDGKMSPLYAEIASHLSFIDSEIIAQPEETLQAAIAQGGPNCGYIKELLRRKPHQLQPETEKALAALSPAFGVPYQVYNMAKLADMRFPSFQAGG